MSLYWLCKRRRKKTLIKWWNMLNCWKWPKEMPNPEAPDEPGGPRRNLTMKAIERELGLRVIFGRIGRERSDGQ